MDSISVIDWSDSKNADPVRDIEEAIRRIKDDCDIAIEIEDIGYCHGTFHLKDYYSENEVVCFGI